MKRSPVHFIRGLSLGIVMIIAWSCVSSDPISAPSNAPEKVGAAPAPYLEYGPGKDSLGVVFGPMPAEIQADWAELSYESATDFKVTYSRSTSGIDPAPLENWVEYTKSGKKVSIGFAFPAKGVYYFKLYATGATPSGDILVFSLRMTSSGEKTASGLPENWQASPRYRTSGIKISSMPNAVLGDIFVIEFDPPGAGTKISCLMSHKASKATVSFTETKGPDGRIRFAGPLSIAGEYEFLLRYTSADTMTKTLATAVFKADIDPALSPYRYGEKEPWPRLPIGIAKKIDKTWLAPAGSFPFEDAFSATLQKDLEITLLSGSVIVKKGTTIEFGCRNESQVDAIDFALPADLVRTVNGQDVTFKAGTRFRVGEGSEGGVLSKPMTVKLAGADVDLPKGSFVAIEEKGMLLQILPSGPIPVRIGGKAYTCQGISYGPYAYGEIYLGTSFYENPDASGELYLEMAKSAPFTFGNASFTLAVKGRIGLKNGKVVTIVTMAEMDMVMDGVKSKLPASRVLTLDEKGKVVIEEAKGF